MSKLIDNKFHPINPDTFLDNYVHNIHKVNNRLSEYMKNPNEKNIHDIRTSIRRLEASYMASPKQMRRGKIIEYVIKSKSLFKINSEIRDFDIILEKLTKEGQLPSQQLESFEKSIKKSRNRKLKYALSVACELRELAIPRLNKYVNHHDPFLFQKKLTTRYTKTVTKYASKINKNISIVIHDSEKIKELHEVRKNTKKLRYLLELILNHKDESIGKNNEIINNNHSNDLNIWNRTEKLKKIQDMLGNVHDYDITITYLKQHDKQKNFVTEMNIVMQRKNKYEQFIQYYEPIISNNGDTFLLPM